MNKISVGAYALNQTPLDWEGNKSRILQAIEKAEKTGVDFLCLPELCITGYGCEDSFFYDFVQKKAEQVLLELSYSVKNMVVSVGLPVVFENALYNCAAVLFNGQILGIVPKQNLSSDGVHYEKRWFKEWPKNVVVETDIGPMGDLIFDFDDIKLGFEICEDAWVADRPGIDLSKRGVNLIFNPSASHFAINKHKIRENFIIEGSRAFNCVYVYSNLFGNESGRIIFSGDCYIAQNGKIITSDWPDNFPPNSEIGGINTIVDMDDCRVKQVQTASFKPSFQDFSCIYNDSFWPERKLSSKVPMKYDPGNAYCQFDSAVTRGLYDYMRKTKSSGYVVSLSGGVDSTACALLVHNMAGHFNLKTEEILTCVYQKTKNSSIDTEDNARQFALAIGAKYHCIDVNSFVEKYTELTEQMLGRKLDWETDDIALQNIQARVRAPSVWMLANVKNAILISTSNRSEAAVGYATLDGDTCGGLAPIAGIDKQFLLKWLEWYSYGYCDENEQEAIDMVLEQKPTAELRPLENRQTDEEDLMPYYYLDLIERKAIHEKKSPKEVLVFLKETAYNADKNLPFAVWVKKFFQMWARNQYKRERYAVSFHLDDANLDPKSWCRFPVLNSGFAEELKDL